MPLAIQSIGTQRPAHTIRQDLAARIAVPLCCTSDRHARLLPALYRRSSVADRGSVLMEHNGGPDPVQSFFPRPIDETDTGPTTHQRMIRYAQEATPLALGAARSAMERAGLLPSAVTQLVTVSCTGFSAPGVDVELIRQLGLSADVGRTHIGFMGCHGALNAMRVAAAMAHAQPNACVLVCAVELCSLHFQYGWQPQHIVANALFADGAAAAVCTPPVSDRGNTHWHLVASGSCVLPESQEEMGWHITDHGFVMTLSPTLPNLIRQHLAPWLGMWLNRHGHHLDEVASWAIHPGGPRILDAVANALGLPDAALEDSREVLARCGNMSSPTVLFVLDRLLRRGAPRPCVAIGLGPGVAIEAAVFV